MPVDPSQDFEQFVREVAQDVINKTPAVVGNNAQPSQPTPLSLNVGGQTFTYNSPAELEASLNQFITKTSQTMHELQQQAQTASAQPPAQDSFVTGDEAPAWDDSEFVNRMTESPRKGLEYAFNQLFFDGQSQNPAEDMKRALQETELTKRSIAAYQFKENHPEFPGGAQAAAMIDNIRQQLGFSYDYNGLESAYLIGIQRGALPNYYALQQQAAIQAQQQMQSPEYQNQQQYSPQPQGNPGQFQGQPGQMSPGAFNGGFGINQAPFAQPQGPPMVSRGGSQGYNPQPNFEDMSLDQLEQLVTRINQGMRR